MNTKFYPLALCALITGAALTTVARADKPAADKPAAAKPSAPAAQPAAPAKGADAEDKTYPAQSSVAAKTAFATIAASDKAVAQALDAKALADALKLVGKPGAFQGTVSQVYSPRDHDVTILDFAPHYRDALTAPVKPDAYAKFPDLSRLVGKHVLISGKFSTNSHGVAQIELTGPIQVKIVQ